jgi:eukaryotic translation initiation factor 2C
MGQGDLPKFTVIIAQKNHHTKLFQADSPENVPPGKHPCPVVLLNTAKDPSPLNSLSNLHFVFASGTVVDSGIVHPRQYDFYMCAHAGPIVSSPRVVLDFA